MSEENIKRQYVGVKDAAKCLGISTTTLRKYIKAGKVPYKRYGESSTILIPLDSLQMGKAKTS